MRFNDVEIILKLKFFKLNTGLCIFCRITQCLVILNGFMLFVDIVKHFEGFLAFCVLIFKEILRFSTRASQETKLITAE